MFAIAWDIIFCSVHQIVYVRSISLDSENGDLLNKTRVASFQFLFFPLYSVYLSILQELSSSNFYDLNVSKLWSQATIYVVDLYCNVF